MLNKTNHPKHYRFIKPLNELTGRNIRLVGGKAANLGELTKAGFPVPKGFVLLTSAFQHFLKINHITKIVNAAKLEKLILNTSFPAAIKHEIKACIHSMHLKTIAIRSSATQEDNQQQSYAGLFDTYFSDATEMLFHYIKKCWISLFKHKASLYGKQNVSPDNQMAVLVQALIFSSRAGVAFSNDPITLKNEINIEACIGMGTELVSGHVTPDHYQVNSRNLKAIEKNIQKQHNFACYEKDDITLKHVPSYLIARQKLSDKQIRSLSMLIKNVKNYFHSPVDVEWALEKDHFYILQARPISAYSNQSNAYEVEWNNHQTLWETDLSMKTFVNYPHIPWNQTNNIYATYSKGHVITYRGLQDREKAAESGKIFMNKSFFSNFCFEIEENYKQQLVLFAKLEKLNFSELSKEELVALLEEIVDKTSMSLSYFRASDATESSYVIEQLRHKISQPELFFLLLTPHHVDLVDDENKAWLRLLKKSPTDPDFLRHAKKYPWIMTNYFSYRDCLDFLHEKWCYDKKHPPKDLTHIKETRHIKKQSAILTITDSKILYLIQVIDFLATSRMKMKNGWAGIHFYLIPFFKEIARRTDEKVDDIVKYYLIDDIKKLIMTHKKLSKTVKLKRYRGFKLSFCKKQLCYENYHAEKKQVTDEFKNHEAEFITGQIANTGKVIGIATVLLSNNKADYHAAISSFKKQDILVTDMTQPQLVDLASQSGAMVTDEGGILSHAAILARELNIPCIVGTHHATDTIHTGDLICVDAFQGKVTILQRGLSP